MRMTQFLMYTGLTFWTGIWLISLAAIFGIGFCTGITVQWRRCLRNCGLPADCIASDKGEQK